MLKCVSGILFHEQKAKGFSSDRKILISLSVLFQIFIFSQDIWGNVHYVPEINLKQIKDS